MDTGPPPTMAINLIYILILGLVQGAAELLPVSSSAHVIVVEKLLGLDPSSPEMSFVLVMLHTGTMFAVIVFFWNAWGRSYFFSAEAFWQMVRNVIVATVFTAIVGLVLQFVIEKIFLKGGKAEIETLFSNLLIIGIALVAVAILIFVSGVSDEHRPREDREDVRLGAASVIGIVQGFCIPFRGFSRSGATISTGLLAGIGRRRMEEFSFALAVILTPPAIARELWRLKTAHPEVTSPDSLVQLALPGLLGMVASFIAGLIALRLLSGVLESGRWKFFSFYCVAFAIVVFALHFMGF
jgi:undecaprenyl-diphosphatase